MASARGGAVGFALAALVGLLAAVAALAAPGDLDPSFNGTGQRTIEPRGQYATVADVLVQPDGKILVAARASSGQAAVDGDTIVLRLNPDGTPDASFGTGGTVAIDYNNVGFTGSIDDFPTSLALQSTGKILIGGFLYADAANQGQTDETKYGTVTRLNADGSPDPTFGVGGTDNAGNGRLVLTLFTNGIGQPQRTTSTDVRDLLVKSDDRIVLAGTFGIPFVLGLTADGQRDTTFGTGICANNGAPGVVCYPGAGTFTAVARAPGGDVILAGADGENDGFDIQEFTVARLSGAGLPVTNFGTGGKRTLNEVGYGTLSDIAVQPDGKIVLAANASETTGSPGQGSQGLIRLNPDGSYDTLDGLRFKAVTPGTGNDASVEIDPAGRLLFGSFLIDTSNRSLRVSRLTAAGGLDLTFGGGTGSVTGALGPSTGQGRGYTSPELALQSDNGIIVASSAAGKLDLRRYLGDPLPVNPPPPPADTIAPAISSVKQSAKRWRVGAGLPVYPRARARAAKAPVGTTFSYGLNEPATVAFSFEAATSGRKAGKKCVAPTKANRKKKRCTRYLVRGKLSRSAAAGAGRLRFQGRITKSKKLRPGAYRLRIEATDAAGNRSAAKYLKFTVVR